MRRDLNAQPKVFINRLNCQLAEDQLEGGSTALGRRSQNMGRQTCPTTQVLESAERSWRRPYSDDRWQYHLSI